MALTAKEKYCTGMAGEFGVCSELYKRGYEASITMGNYKAVDIIVSPQNGRAQRIEVKTSRNKRKTIVTGFFQKYASPNQIPHPDYWVLVYIDKNDVSHYYVLTHQEMATEQMRRNGMSQWAPIPKNKGVDNVLVRDLSNYESAWNKIPK